MTIELDTSLDEKGQRKTNLHPNLDEPGAYQINQSAGMIKITIKDAAGSLVKLVTDAGDFLDMDSTQVSDGQLTVSFHKPESITGGSIERVGLTGDYFLEVKKTMHRREERFVFKVTVLAR